MRFCRGIRGRLWRILRGMDVVMLICCGNFDLHVPSLLTWIGRFAWFIQIWLANTSSSLLLES
jgi:hypothetical protein